MKTQKNQLSIVKKSLDLCLEQLKFGFDLANKISLPKSYQAVTKILVAGMGGSHLQADFINSVFANCLLKPVIIVSDYILPNWVNKDTLVIAVSYSGNTEEVLSIAKQVELKKVPLMVVTAGGNLATVRSPKIIFNTDLNPSKQPRYGTGYLIGIQLGILKQIQAIDFAWADLDDVLAKLDLVRLAVLGKAQAKKLAQKQIFLISAEHLTGLAIIFRNQIHETAKQLAFNYNIPELNHHLLESLSFPKLVIRNSLFVFYESRFYSKRIQQRMSLTEKIVSKQGAQTIVVKNLNKNILLESLTIWLINSYVSYYLAEINKQNPTAIPWVDYFKAQLK